MTLSSRSVISPSAKRLARKRAMAGSPPDERRACGQAFSPDWTTSTWPMADTCTPAMFGLVAVR
jgi:hypothetical protein